MSTDPRAAPPAGPSPAGPPPAGPSDAPPAGHPRWTGKPVRQLTTAELAEALEFLERHHPDDEILGRALAGEFARRTAAAEFARRTTVDRRDAQESGPGGRRAPGKPRPASPDLDGPSRPPLMPQPGRPRTPQ